MTRDEALAIVQPVIRQAGEQLQGTRAALDAYDEAIELLGWLNEVGSEQPSQAPRAAG